MENKVIISASVPTAYQYSSINRFGMEIKKHGNGSYSAVQEFNSEDEAKDYLRKRADIYADTEQEQQELYAQIEEYGSLTLDACTAMIEELEEEWA